MFISLTCRGRWGGAKSPKLCLVGSIPTPGAKLMPKLYIGDLVVPIVGNNDPYWIELSASQKEILTHPETPGCIVFITNHPNYPSYLVKHKLKFLALV